MHDLSAETHRQLRVDVPPVAGDAPQLLEEQAPQLAQLLALVVGDVEGAGDLGHARVGGLPGHVVHLAGDRRGEEGPPVMRQAEALSLHAGGRRPRRMLAPASVPPRADITR